MKSTFTLNPFIVPALVHLGVDLPKLINAVQASLGSAREVPGDETVKRGNVKLVKDEDGIKGADFTFTEGETHKYRGKTDAPARFGKWHDALATFFKKNGEPNGDIDASIIPPSLKFWLVEKMLLPVDPASNVPAPATPAANTGNGKARGKGQVTPNVPAPAAPSA